VKPTDDDLKRDAATDLVLFGAWGLARAVYDGTMIHEARAALPAWIRRAQAAEAEVARLRAEREAVVEHLRKGGDL
jgi:hypothetical protein